MGETRGGEGRIESIHQGKRLFPRRKRRLCDKLAGNVFEARAAAGSGTKTRDGA